MNVSSELVTVYRSADQDASQDASLVHEKLLKAGYNPVIVADNTPGVIEGSYEVRVPAAEAAAAESFINSRSEEDLESGDESHRLDLETIQATDGALSEMEAQSIQSLLDSNGIHAVIIGTTTLPNLGFEIRVPRNEVQRAHEVISEARNAGPAAAEEAERASEGQPIPEA
jgi:hypothetical protein